MLPDTLTKVKSVFLNSKSLNLNKKELNNYIDLLKKYNKDSFIYPSVVMHTIELSTEETLLSLEILVNIRILETNYVLICPYCGYKQRNIYTNFKSISLGNYCEDCGIKIEDSKLLNSIICIYRVIINE